jgi:hypothetical protein
VVTMMFWLAPYPPPFTTSTFRPVASHLDSYYQPWIHYQENPVGVLLSVNLALPFCVSHAISELAVSNPWLAVFYASYHFYEFETLVFTLYPSICMTLIWYLVNLTL